MEDENADPVGTSPRQAFYVVAVRAGLIRDVDPLDQNLVDYALGVVELCASIGDVYTNDYGNAGEHIRAELRDA